MRVTQQIRPVLTLAGPLILAELGWMTMGVVDTMMVGHMDRPVLAIGASALGGVLYNTVGFGIAGILLGLDTYLSQAHGAGEFEEAGRWLLHGLLLAAGLAGVLGGLIWVAPALLMRLPMDRAVLVGAGEFLRGENWGTPALFLYFVLRRYLQAFNHVRPIAVALVSANLLNVFFDWLLIYGHAWGHAWGHPLGHPWGQLSVPAMGVYGAGLSTSLARLYLAGFMVWMVLRVNRRHDYGLKTMTRRFERARVWRLARLGAPAGGQIFVEISIFGMVTFLIGAMGPLPLAGHEIALNCASFTFMIPFAISAATAVRVGQGVGRKAPEEARAEGSGGGSGGGVGGNLAGRGGDGGHGAGLIGRSAADRGRLHPGCRRHRGGGAAARCSRGVSVLRWPADYRDRRAQGGREYACGSGGPVGRVLGDWPARWVVAWFSDGLGCAGPLGGFVCRAGGRGGGADYRLGQGRAESGAGEAGISPSHTLSARKIASDRIRGATPHNLPRISPRFPAFFCVNLHHSWCNHAEENGQLPKKPEEKGKTPHNSPQPTMNPPQITTKTKAF